MEITDVQVYPLNSNGEGKLRAFARIVVGGVLQLTSLRIYEGSRGLFVSYPNDPMHRGEDYRQLIYPIDKDFRLKIEETILKAYISQTRGLK